jgi:hypothetical protein
MTKLITSAAVLLAMSASASAESAYCESSMKTFMEAKISGKLTVASIIDAVRRDCQPGDTIAVDGPVWAVGLLCDFTKTIASYSTTTVCVMAAEKRGIRGK